MRTYHDIFDTFVLELRGEGGSISKLRGTFDEFQVSEPSGTVDLVCKLSKRDPDPEEVFGAPDDHYGREGDWFVVQNPEGYGHLSINKDWEHILVAPDIDHYFVAYVVEFLLRKRLSEEGYGLVHASGVKMGDSVLLFQAWRYTGKTNTLMTLLRNGADYLSDDRLWVNQDGTVLGYPVPINMMPSNIESYPGLSAMSREEKFRSWAADEIYDRLNQRKSIVHKGLSFATKQFIEPNLGRQLVDLDQLIPGTEFVPEAEVTDIVTLRTTLKSDGVSTEEVSGEEVLADVRSVNDYEWDGRLREYCLAYDALFSGGSKTEELDAVIERELENLDAVFDDVATYRAFIPRERDWQSTGIDDQIHTEMRRLTRSKPHHESVQ